MRAVPVLVAILLTLSSPAMAAVASSPGVQDSEESSPNTLSADQTTNRLVLDDPMTRSHASPSLDLSATLAGKDDTMRTDYQTYTLDTGFDQLSADEQRALVEDAVDRLDARIDRLEERERTAVERHANGELDDRQLLRVFVRNYRESIELEQTLQTLKTRADTVPDYSLDKNPYEARLNMYQSPVRDRLEKSLQGLGRSDGSPDVLYVETSEDGYVVSTILSGRYLREAVRYDNRDPDRENQFDGASDALERSTEIYPWILDNDDFSPTPIYIPYTAIQVYTIDVSHPQGDLHAYIDGGTADIFREVQELRLEELPNERVGTWTNDGLTMSINRTPVDGPFELTVVDEETGTPVDAEIEIDGTRVGDTKNRERTWVIPPSADYEVTVRDGDRSVNATVSPWND